YVQPLSHPVTNTFCYYDNTMFFTTLMTSLQAINHSFKIMWVFRYNNTLCPASKTGIKCSITCISTHYFNNISSLMGCWSISNFVNCIYDCIQCCVESNCIIHNCNIIIYSSWNPYAWNTCLS